MNPDAKSGMIEKFVSWRRRHVSDSVTLMLAAALLGCAAGFGAFLLKFLIGHLTDFFTARFGATGPYWPLLVLPGAGIILAAGYQRCLLHDNLTHGVGRLGDDLRHRRYALPAHLIYGPTIASTITLGFGGSAGAEGPIAYTGAAMGSNLGRWLGLSPGMLRILIGCGAGAGIAGIFKAPIGGALFTLEVMKMSLGTVSVLALVVAAVCGSLTCMAFTDFTPDIVYFPAQPFEAQWIGWLVALGVFCGIYSVYYSAVLEKMQRVFVRLNSRSPWLMNVAGGLILGLAVFLFPILYGEGYSTVTRIVNGDFHSLLQGSVFSGAAATPVLLLTAMCGVLLLKCWATVASNSAGGVAGDFAPTIFAGAIAGYVFATAANMFMGASLPVGVFALMATAGVFSGAIHAPLMGMFLTAEFAGAYHYFPGLALVAVTAYITMKVLTPHSLYITALHDDIDALLHIGRHKQ